MPTPERFLHCGLDKEPGESACAALERLAAECDENGIDCHDRHLACRHWSPELRNAPVAEYHLWQLHLCPDCFDEVQVDLAFGDGGRLYCNGDKPREWGDGLRG